MKNHNYYVVLSTIIVMLLASCASSHKVRVSYKISEDYKQAQSKLDKYYKGRKINFSLFQDGYSPESYETINGKEHVFTLSRHAPDIGSNEVEKATLRRVNPKKCSLDVELYDSDVGELENWLTSNLNITSISSQKLEP